MRFKRLNNFTPNQEDNLFNNLTLLFTRRKQNEFPLFAGPRNANVDFLAGNLNKTLLFLIENFDNVSIYNVKYQITHLC